MIWEVTLSNEDSEPLRCTTREIAQAAVIADMRSRIDSLLDDIQNGVAGDYAREEIADIVSALESVSSRLWTYWSWHPLPYRVIEIE